MKKTFTYMLGGLFLLTSMCAAAQPANDDVCNAQSATLGTPLTGNCNMATVEPNEVSPPNNGLDCDNDWCDGTLDGSVWYTFTAPASGVVTISSCSDNNTADTQFAVYDAGDCSDFGTFMLLAANDDKPNGCSSGTSDYASEVSVCDLVPGTTYYLQVDGYNGDPNDFELTVTAENACPLIAYLQFYHASADLAVATVDIRLNGTLIADNLSYGEATPFILIDEIINTYLTINPSNSTDDGSAYAGLTVTLPIGSRLVVPLIGIYSPTGYNTSVTGPGSLSFTGIEIPTGPVNPNNQHIAIFNTVTDVAGFRYFYEGVDAYGPVAFGASLSEEYLLTNHPFDLYALTNPTHYGQFEVPFENYTGQSIAVVTSGFTDPSQNSNGPALSMCVVKSDGSVDCFWNALSIEEQVFGNEVILYPNPANDQLNVLFQQESAVQTLIELTDILGQVVYSGTLNDLQTGQQTIAIPTGKLENGTYHLHLRRGTAVSVPRAVVITH